MDAHVNTANTVREGAELPSRGGEGDGKPEAGDPNDASLRALIAGKDWSETPLGARRQWSPTLRMMVDFLLANRFPLLLWWGPDYVSIYNDAYRPILGTKHPRALGLPFRDVWPEVADVLTPLIDAPFSGGPATWMDDIPLEINRYGFVEESHFTIAYSPVPDDTALRGIGGVLATVCEITEKIIGERRLAVLRDLGACTGAGRTAKEACSLAAAALRSHNKDIPFALFYLLDETGARAELAATIGVEPGAPAAIETMALGGAQEAATAWPLAAVLETNSALTVEHLGSVLATVPAGPWSEPPEVAVVLPIRSSAEIAGFLVAGVSSRLRLDDQYRSFLDLVATQISTAVTSACSYEEERKRAQALAELDRAKTMFFSNVSHEFRTPLTLMLGPLEEALLRPAENGGDRMLLETAHRNGLRLLKLVNSLLDFSRIEAGRVEATYRPTDLAACTAELVSTFRSAIDRAGLRLVTDCPPLGEPAYVDRDMWEKIVLNLVSNAFKFTLEGEIEVALRATGEGSVALSVRDTGAGIPAAELPRIFERFHRIEGSKGRSFEGSGIGLALVQELVKLHGGTIRAESELGRGSVFAVEIPLGAAHLPADRVQEAAEPEAGGVRPRAYVEEALRWVPGIEMGAIAASPDGTDLLAGAAGTRVIVADDNADMRSYVVRLLSERGYAVEAVADGAAALAAVRRLRPDLVLADVMMPRLDGFALVQALRGDPALADLPVILLSARAGEEAHVEGLRAGADDYLVKPFAARELLARVGVHLKMARARREAAEALRARSAELEAVLATVPTAVWFTSDLEGAEVWGNRQASELLRVAPGVNASLSTPIEKRPRRFQAFRGDKEAAAETLPLRRALRGEAVRNDEFDIRFEDGRSITLLAQAMPLRNSEGAIVGAVSAAVDITTQKEAEATLRGLNEILASRIAAEIKEREQAEAALRQAQKMEAIGQLTGGVAHDFNNLLQVVVGNLDALRRRVVEIADTRVQSEIARYAQSALKGAERAATLTQRLLAFSRRQALNPQAVDVNKLVAGMADLLRRTLGETIAVRIGPSDATWPVEVDPNQLESALLNLAVNARDAMPGGGELTLRTANVQIGAADAMKHEDVPQGDYVMLAIGDTGVGMSEEIIAKACEPFFTTKEAGHGTGLGLSQVYGFVRQSGGYVTIRSRIGDGTTVELLLPRHHGEARQRTSQTAAAPARSARGELVLLVEDNDDVRAASAQMLRELGYRIVEAADGRSALAMLEREPEIRLMFSDIGLPGGMGGRELAEAAHARRPLLPIVFTTGYVQEAGERNGRIASGIDVIAKPFSFAALAAKLRESLDAAANP